MRLGVIGLDGEGLVVAGNGLIQLAKVLERKAKVAVRCSQFGLYGQRLVNEINGNVVFANLMSYHTKEVQGDRLIGFSLQYLVINVLSLR